ncbi:MAG: NAD(P)-dependent oxidoreductase, partial [Sulfurimonas sp.]|nr:NAD(P)-dependent oxidoreductase [Sulfurimonas sp.]
MIVGSGQLAKEFEKSEHGDVVIFASGVSNSTCKDENEFIREKNLLESMLNSNKEKKIVYFSSCALSAPDYAKNAYYEHKKQMEELIRLNSNNYYIFRIPQLFGKLKHHKTLINFLYEAIINGDKFNVYSGAYRYVIEIEDVRKLVEAYLNYSEPNIVVDIANTYRYNILEVVSILERLLGKKAIYDVIEKSDEYVLDLSRVQDFIKR